MKSSEPLIEKEFTAFLNPYAGQAVVVAVSGGADSVCLLRLFSKFKVSLKLEVYVGHLNHHARGPVSDADSAFVVSLSKMLNLPVHLGDWHPARDSHFEADARRARYEWLAEVASREGAGLVATGHTRDDQVETILHRIVRGTGLRGLAGIPSTRPLAAGVRLIRPLLRTRREEIRAYLRMIGQDWREDATNADQSRARSRIRHELLPLLRKGYNPKVDEALINLGDLARSSDDALDAWIRAWLAKNQVTMRQSCLRLPADALRKQSPHIRIEIIRWIWREAGWPQQRLTASHWKSLGALVDHSGSEIDLVMGIRAKCDESELTIERPE